MNRPLLTLISVFPFITQSIILSLLTATAVLFVIKLLSIRNSKTKIILYIMPFVIPVVMPGVIHLTLFKTTYWAVGPLYGLLHFNRWLFSHGDTKKAVLIIICILPFLILLIRGALGFISVRRLLTENQVLTCESNPDVFSILKELKKITGVSCSKVIQLDDRKATAFTYGVYRPVLAISGDLLSCLNRRELKIIFAHEFAHIKRKDGLTLWVIKALRDLTFYNPVVYRLPKLISREQEQACDMMVCSWLGNPLRYARTLLKVWQMSLCDCPANVNKVLFSQSPYLLKEGDFLKRRIKSLMEVSKSEERFFQKAIFPWSTFVIIELVLIKAFMVPIWVTARCGFLK